MGHHVPRRSLTISHQPRLKEVMPELLLPVSHTQKRLSVDYIIVEVYGVPIGGNRDSFQFSSRQDVLILPFNCPYSAETDLKQLHLP